MNFKVEWTGSYPCLCFGKWIVKYKEQELELPEEIASESMDTYGTYNKWYFTKGWSEVFEDYEDGLQFEEWYEQNKQWLHELFDKYSIPKDIELFEELYYEFQSEDWRHGSCGGCI